MARRIFKEALFEKENLIKVAICIAPITLGGALFFKRRIEQNFESQEFFQKSLKILDGYTLGIALIGRPYKLRRVNIGDRGRNFTDGVNAGMHIEVKGKERTCYLQTWCSRPEVGKSWDVDKANLECDDKIWTFYINPAKVDSIKPTKSLETLKTSNEDISNKEYIADEPIGGKKAEPKDDMLYLNHNK